MRLVFNNGEESLGIGQIANDLGVNEVTVYAWLKAGKLPNPEGKFANGKYWRRSTIENWKKTLKRKYYVE